MRSEAVDADDDWRGQVLQRIPLIGFVEKGKTMTGLGYDRWGNNNGRRR